MSNLYNVTFKVAMDEYDVGAMNDFFHKVMDEEMHIDCKNLNMEIQ